MTSPLRIGQLSAHLSRSGGGIYTALRELCGALALEEGLQVEVFGPEPSSPAEFPPTVRMRTFPRGGPASLGYAPALLGSLLACQPDVLHLHGLWMHPSAAARAYRRRTARPLIISPHGMLDGWALRNSRWKKRLAAMAFENANLRGAACLHALCAAEAEAMREYGLTNPVCVIPNGVEVPGAPPVRRSGPAGRSLLYLGRLHPKKGLPALLRAWAQAKHEAWRLIIAGWDENGHEAELRALAAELRVDVSFPGPLFQEAKAAAFASCDGFILPSLSEGLPVVVLEAWAHGKPVLMTPQCNLPEGYSAGAALRIEPNVEGIREGLERFFSLAEQEREAMGGRGFALVRERFAWPEIAREMRRVYEWLQGRGPRPSTIWNA